MRFSGEGCSLLSEEKLGRRLEIPAGPQRRKRKKRRAGGHGASTVAVRRRLLAVPARYSLANCARCSAKRHLAEGWIYQQDLSGGKEKREKGRRARCLHGPSRPKHARCSSMICSGEGCSLLSEGCSLFQHDILRRRVLAAQRRDTWPKAGCTSRTPAEAQKNKKKGPQGTVLPRS
jgi:hypothetical protein